MLLGYGVGINQDGVAERLNLSYNSVGVRVVRNIDEGLRATDYPALRVERGLVSEGLHGLHSYDDVGAPLRYEGGRYGSV